MNDLHQALTRIGDELAALNQFLKRTFPPDLPPVHECERCAGEGSFGPAPCAACDGSGKVAA